MIPNRASRAIIPASARLLPKDLPDVTRSPLPDRRDGTSPVPNVRSNSPPQSWSFPFGAERTRPSMRESAGNGLLDARLYDGESRPRFMGVPGIPQTWCLIAAAVPDNAMQAAEGRPSYVCKVTSWRDGRSAGAGGQRNASAEMTFSCFADRSCSLRQPRPSCFAV